MTQGPSSRADGAVVSIRPPMSVRVIAWSWIGAMLLLVDGLFLYIAIRNPGSLAAWLLLIVAPIPTLPAFVFAMGGLFKCLRHLTLWTGSLETKIRLFKPPPRVSLDDLSGIGLVLTTIGRTTDWWLCYGDAQGELRIIDPMSMGQRLRQHDAGTRLAESRLGRFAAAVESQTREIQGPNGRIATNNAFDRLEPWSRKASGTRTLRPREVWTPRGGFERLTG